MKQYKSGPRKKPFTKVVKGRGSRKGGFKGTQGRSKKYDYCGKLGHIKSACYVLHPELRLKATVKSRYKKATNTRNRGVFKKSRPSHPPSTMKWGSKGHAKTEHRVKLRRPGREYMEYSSQRTV